jgi:hypothetical protein
MGYARKFGPDDRDLLPLVPLSIKEDQDGAHFFHHGSSWSTQIEEGRNQNRKQAAALSGQSEHRLRENGGTLETAQHLAEHK